YIGSVVPFLVVIGLILSAGDTGDALPAPQARVGFIVVACWWLIFSLPALRHLRQRSYPAGKIAVVGGSFRRLLTTLKDIRRHRQAFVFLVAYFFFIDGVGTIISMSTAYGRDLGFGVTLLIVVLLVIQIVAFPFALVYGKLAERFGTKNTLLAGIVIYCLITLLAFLLPFIANPTTKVALFWLIAVLVASSMGGIQALSRSYFGRLIPPEKSAEFFGFYNVFGKFAAIAGPLLMGLIARATGDSRWGVLSILLLFAVGGWILSRIKEN
ncbi:MAG: MFS transporter, partial [Desulfofustis sp.]|nr:MFS transporter [Desulfofustis sp.]